MIAILPSASATKGRKKSAVEKKEIVVAHMANKRQIPEKEKKIECKHGIPMSLYNTHYHYYYLKYILRYIGIIVKNKLKTYSPFRIATSSCFLC